jgi:hypothetical protein
MLQLLLLQVGEATRHLTMLQALTSESAYRSLIDLLQHQLKYEKEAAEASAELDEVLECQRETEELSKLHELWPVAKGEGCEGKTRGLNAHGECHLSDDMVMTLLRRELLLTSAKQGLVLYEAALQGEQSRRVSVQIQQVMWVVDAVTL